MTIYLIGAKAKVIVKPSFSLTNLSVGSIIDVTLRLYPPNDVTIWEGTPDQFLIGKNGFRLWMDEIELLSIPEQRYIKQEKEDV